MILDLPPQKLQQQLQTPFRHLHHQSFLTFFYFHVHCVVGISIKSKDVERVFTCNGRWGNEVRMWRIFRWKFVELIPLVERGRRLPYVNEVHREKNLWAIVRKFPERTLWIRVETNRELKGHLVASCASGRY
jgi:hypothetical protein